LGYKALALALSNLVSLLLVIPLVWYLFKDRPKGVFDKDLAKKYIKISIPLIILSVAETLMVTFDKVLLQFFTNSEQVGYYTASFRIGGLFLIIVSGISIFFPLFSKAFAEGDLFYIKDKIDKYERIIFLFVMPTVLLITIYSDAIIKLILGNQYINSIVPMSIITIAIFIKVVTLPYSNVLTGKGLFKLTAKLSVVALIGFLSILCILVHPQLFNLKAEGAAMAILLTHLLLGILYIIFARMNLKPLREIKNGKFVIFGIINFLFFFFLYNGLKDDWGLTFVIAFPFFYYTLTYLFLYKLKWIGESEMRIIKSVIDIKAIKEYVSSEIKGKGE
jgi:O-antigen/teichoic acid export membrane protein